MAVRYTGDPPIPRGSSFRRIIMYQYCREDDWLMILFCRLINQYCHTTKLLADEIAICLYFNVKMRI